jgi:hypothetical protein
LAQADNHNSNLPGSPVTPTAPDVQRRLVRRRRRRSPIKKVSRRVGRFLNWKFIVLVIFSGLAVYGVTTAVIVTDALGTVNDSLISVRRVVDQVGRNPGEFGLNDFTRLQTSVNDLVRSLNIARNQTAVLRTFSSVNPEFAATLDALNTTEGLALAARDTLAGLEPTLFFMLGDEQDLSSQVSSGERIVELLTIGRGRFQQSQNRLRTVGQQLIALPDTGLSPELLTSLTQIRSYYEQLVSANTLLLELPDLLTTALAVDETRSYLILSANSDELRPSGGYISTYGWMRIRNGRILDYDYSPTGVNSPNPPPAELAAEIAAPDWWLPFSDPIRTAWDGSWTPDFAQTAERAAWYYNNGRNPQSPVSGVIGIDLVGFEYILGAIGSVRVPGYNTVVTPANFRQLVYDIRAFGQGEEPHKAFVAAIFSEIFAAWQTGSYTQERSAQLLSATIRALTEKHLMLYFVDPQLNDVISQLGWAGQQDTGTGYDYLMVADSTLGNKSARSIIRQITYDVELMPDGSAQGRSTLTYDYPASVAVDDPAVDPEFHGQLDYFTLTQLYIPQGAQTVEESELVSSFQMIELDTRTLLTGYLYVPYNSGERFQFSYSTPGVSSDFGDFQRYRLLIQKQPGTINDPVSVQITLPRGSSMVNSRPAPVATFWLEQQILEFRAELNVDQWIEVVYRTPNE